MSFKVHTANVVKVFEEAMMGGGILWEKSHGSYSVLSIQLSYFRMRNHEKGRKKVISIIYNYIIYYRYRNFFTYFTPNVTHKQEN